MLPAVEQFGLTGGDRLNGFSRGEFTSDIGALSIFSWKFVPLEHNKYFKSLSKHDVSIIPGIYAEYGYGKQNSSTSNSPSETATLADIGISFDMKWRDKLSARLTVAQPLQYDISYIDSKSKAAHAYLGLVWYFN